MPATCSHCDVVERLVRVETKLDALLKDLTDNGQPSKCTRHANAIAALQNWRSYVNGALAVISVITTGLVAIAVALASSRPK